MQVSEITAAGRWAGRCDCALVGLDARARPLSADLDQRSLQAVLIPQISKTPVEHEQAIVESAEKIGGRMKEDDRAESDSHSLVSVPV